MFTTTFFLKSLNVSRQITKIKKLKTIDWINQVILSSTCILSKILSIIFRFLKLIKYILTDLTLTSNFKFINIYCFFKISTIVFWSFHIIKNSSIIVVNWIITFENSYTIILLNKTIFNWKSIIIDNVCCIVKTMLTITLTNWSAVNKNNFVNLNTIDTTYVVATIIMFNRFFHDFVFFCWNNHRWLKIRYSMWNYNKFIDCIQLLFSIDYDFVNVLTNQSYFVSLHNSN